MAVTTGPNAGLKAGWAARGDGWDADMSANIDALDARLHLAVAGRQNAPPTSPSDGDRYVVGSGSGAWSGKDNQLAVYRTTVNAWTFYPPRQGMVMFREDQGRDFIWNGASWVPKRTAVSAANFSSLQSAVDATPRGGVLEIPDGPMVMADENGVFFNDPITVIGAGAGTDDGTTDGGFIEGSYGTILVPASVGGTTKDSTVLNVAADDVAIRDVMIAANGKPSAAGTGDAIRCAVSGSNRTRLTLMDLIIWNMGRDGVHVEGDAGHTLNLLNARRVQSKRCRGRGFYLQNAAFPLLDHVWAAANHSYGLFTDAAVLTRLQNSSFEGNHIDDTGSRDLMKGEARLQLSHCSSIDHCSFEAFRDRSSQVGLTLTNCYGTTLSGNFFGAPEPTNPTELARNQGTIGWVLIGGTQGCMILPNVYDFINTLGYIHPTNLEASTPFQVMNTGNFLFQQIVHNTVSGLDGIVYVHPDTPTYQFFAQGYADSTVPGAPNNAPGGFAWPLAARIPDALARAGMEYVDASTLKKMLCTASGPTPTWAVAGSQS